MRICMVCSHFYPVIGGREIHMLELSKQLIKCGHQVSVLTANLTRIGDRNKLPAFEEISGITIYRFSVLSDWGRGLVFYPGFVKKLIQLQPDVIHAHGGGWLHSDISAVVGRVRSIRCVITAHGFPGGGKVPDPSRARIYQHTITRVALRLADAVIATSPVQKDRLIKRGATEENVYVIPCGLSDEYFCRDVNPVPLKDEYNLDGPVILFLGRLAEVKGIQHLIQAAPSILSQFGNTKFLIVGPDAGVKRRLVNLVEALKLKKQVVFTGALYGQEKRMAIVASDVLVLPSRSEGQPLVLHEAQALGTPVIATRVGGIPHFIEHRENGILIDYGEPDQIVEAVEALLINKKLRTRIIKNGMQTAKSLRWTKIVPRILQVYTGM